MDPKINRLETREEAAGENCKIVHDLLFYFFFSKGILETETTFSNYNLLNHFPLAWVGSLMDFFLFFINVCAVFIDPSGFVWL